MKVKKFFFVSFSFCSCFLSCSTKIQIPSIKSATKLSSNNVTIIASGTATIKLTKTNLPHDVKKRKKPPFEDEKYSTRALLTKVTKSFPKFVPNKANIEISIVIGKNLFWMTSFRDVAQLLIVDTSSSDKSIQVFPNFFEII